MILKVLNYHALLQKREAKDGLPSEKLFYSSAARYCSSWRLFLSLEDCETQSNKGNDKCTKLE